MDTQKILRKAIPAAEAKIRPEFDTMLRQSGWPAAVRDKINLVVTDTSIGVAWPSELDKKIDDLEYGTIGKTPTHLMRRIDEYVDSVVGEEISKATLAIMFSGYMPV